MAAALAEQLVEVRPLLHVVATPKDGHCQYRAVSLQCRRYGYDGHARLRNRAIEHVNSNQEYFRPFFVGDTEDRSLPTWIDAARRGAWGDNVSLDAMSRVLARPVAVWRHSSTQRPTVVVPPGYDADNPTDPIYLELDERWRRKAHYSALKLGNAERCKQRRRAETTRKEADAAVVKKRPAQHTTPPRVVRPTRARGSKGAEAEPATGTGLIHPARSQRGTPLLAARLLLKRGPADRHRPSSEPEVAVVPPAQSAAVRLAAKREPILKGTSGHVRGVPDENAPPTKAQQESRSYCCKNSCRGS